MFLVKVQQWKHCDRAIAYYMKPIDKYNENNLENVGKYRKMV